MSNVIYIILLLFFNSIYGQTNKAIGINTDLPLATLDINGDFIIREVPIQHSGSFYALGVNEKKQFVTKSADVTSYAVYLGLDPKAPSQTQELPINLEDGYITKITGTTIGACYGVMVDFTIVYLGKRYLGATLKGISTQANVVKDFPTVVLDSSMSIFGKPLEELAKATTCPLDGTDGHILTFNNTTNKMKVTFSDKPEYFKDAGTFIIYNIDKILQHE